jgi:hypothetical protein
VTTSRSAGSGGTANNAATLASPSVGIDARVFVNQAMRLDHLRLACHRRVAPDRLSCSARHAQS